MKSTHLAGLTASLLLTGGAGGLLAACSSTTTGSPNKGDGGTSADAGGSEDAGTTEDAPGGDAAASAEAGADGGACAAYAAAECAFLSKCEPGTFAVDYSSSAECQATVTTNCGNALAAPGSGITTAWTAACGALLGTETSACANGPIVRPIPSVTACSVVGAGAAGAPCGVAAQCATDSCVRLGNVCGACSAPGMSGAACGPGTAVTCAAGLSCGAKNTCVPVVGVDAGCDLGVTGVCVGGTDCVIAAAGDKTGTCVVEGMTAGAACNAKGVGAAKCWDAAGFFCSGSSQCEAISYGAPQAACGGVNDGGTTDTSCTASTCVAGVCTAPSAVAEGCTVGAGAGCVAGAICAEDDAGTSTCAPVSLSCAANDAGLPPFSFSPSNVSLATITANSAQAVAENVSSSCAIQTDATAPESDCFASPIEVVTQEDGSTVNLVVVQALQVQTTGSISVTGGVPLIIVSLSDMTFLGGNIQANSSGLETGPGGAAGVSSGVGAGLGGGVAGSTSSVVAPSGGSYCGVGGPGGGAAATATTKAYGTAAIRPLVGGSAGGGSGLATSGSGGGGIQLVAAGTISIGTGSYVTVGGQGGPIGGVAADQNAGAGGSGGSILIEAPTVTITGTLAANGGGGGGDYSGTGGQDATPNATAAQGGAAGASDGAGGNGGADTTVNGGAGTAPGGLNAGGGGGGVGRIRINSSTGAATLTGAVLSPAATTACATQGDLRTIANGP